MLRKFQIEISGIVINRLLPDELEGDFFKGRFDQQSHYLDEISEQFKGVRSIQVGLLERDVHGIEMLKKSANMLSKAISTSEVL